MLDGCVLQAPFFYGPFFFQHTTRIRVGWGKFLSSLAWLQLPKLVWDFYAYKLPSKIVVQCGLGVSQAARGATKRKGGSQESEGVRER